MDHRERMQKEAEQWQEKSVRIIQCIRYGILALGILIVLALFLRNLGFPKEIDELIPAAVISEDGQTLECTLEIRGEVTDYPLNKNKFGADDNVILYANERRLVEVYFKRGGEYLFAQRGDTVCILGARRNVVLLETDVKNIFPEMDSQRCLLVTGTDDVQSVWEEAAGYNLPAEYIEQFTFFQD